MFYIRKIKALLILSFIVLMLFSCEKDVFIGDNDPRYYGGVPTVLVEFYVNRVFIDLIGREPFDEEMENEVAFLRSYDLSMEGRDSLIIKLQTDTTFIEGDSSYKFAYYHRMYDILKVRMMEGASNADIAQYSSNAYQNYIVDSIAGEMLNAYKKLLDYHNLNDVLKSELQYYNGIIGIKKMHRRMIFNSVYDLINMNVFNYINAVFDNLLFRYPTLFEFDESYKMIADNTPQILLGQSGQSKYDFADIICDSREFYEGVIQWTYLTLMARVPTSEEVDKLMNTFYYDYDLQYIQRQIMISDEYAHFK